MAKTQLNIRFHNPNTVEDTVKFLTELLAEIAVSKVIKAQEELMEHYIPSGS